MPRLTRRDFVRGGLAAGAALVLPRSVFGANETVQMGFIGLGGRGGASARDFSGQKDVKVAGVVDADKGRVGALTKRYDGAKGYTDLRRLLDDKNVDGVCVSTCNHWHALATVWACQAGKDVYVEKPVSWSVLEGRQMVEAARKHNRIVQAGMQQRSCPVQKGIQDYLAKGTLGKIKYVRMNRYGLRKSIGKRTTPLPVPDGIDYNLWLGPAKDVPILRERFHYDWHWVWNTGNGEMGNWGPHIIDDLRNAVLRDTVGLPTHCIAGGGRLGYDDAGETPNTHFVYFGGAEFPIIFDCHGLPMKKGTRGGDVYRRRRSRAFLIVECENGYYAGGRGGEAVYNTEGKKIDKISGNGGRNHIPNFLKAVRSRKVEDLNADIEQGHYSAAWCHLGNLSYQVGKKYTKDEALSRVKNCQPWADVLDDLHAHLDANEVDPKKADIKLGAMLEIDPKAEKLTGPSATADAKAIWTGAYRGYRKGFEINV